VDPGPEGKSVVTYKWLFKIKLAADGGIEKYKARFVARGFSQKEGIDYDEIFTLLQGTLPSGPSYPSLQFWVGNFTKW
jgi:hypothetical protein